MDTHLTNISVFAELMGIECKTLHNWYKNYLSGFEPDGHAAIHANDVVVKCGNKFISVEVPIVCPENMGSDMALDEKKIGEDFYSILTNRKTGKIAFCAGSTSSYLLKHALTPLIHQVQEIKTLTRDMSGSFSKLCDELMPDAVQIADKFHVIMNLMEAQQAVRIRYRQQVLEQRRRALQSHKLKEKSRKDECEQKGEKYVSRKFSYKELKLRNGETPSEILSRSHFLLYKYPEQWKPSQRTRAMVLFETYPEIKEVYELACKFRSWYAKENVGNHLLMIEKKLFEWYDDVENCNIDEMLNFKSMVESHEDIILPYFVKGHTNAIAENLNKRIKQFIASNMGLRNKEFFFFRIKNFFA